MLPKAKKSLEEAVVFWGGPIFWLTCTEMRKGGSTGKRPKYAEADILASKVLEAGPAILKNLTLVVQNAVWVKVIGPVSVWSIWLYRAF